MQHSRLRADDGFTLVEILVVILIIGILTAIAVPAFLTQRSKAHDTHARTSVTTAAKAIGVWETERDTFAGASPEDLIKIEPSLGAARSLSVDSAARTFTVVVESVAGGTYSIERRADGRRVRDCSRPGVGSCAETADAQGNRW